MNRFPADQRDTPIPTVLVLLLAGAVLLGMGACYVVGSGVVLADLQPNFAYFFLVNPNLVFLEVLLLVVVGRMVRHVRTDVATRGPRVVASDDGPHQHGSVQARRRRALARGRGEVTTHHAAAWWFEGMRALMIGWVGLLALLVLLSGDIEAALDPTGTGYPVVVSFAVVPFVLAVMGLLYTRRYREQLAGPAGVVQEEGGATGQRLVVVLATTALLLIGLPGVLWLLTVLPNPLYYFVSEPPWHQGIGYLANQAIWQALQLVFIWAVGIFTLVSAAQRRRWGWLGLLVVPILTGMAWVGAGGTLTTWDVAHLLPIPVQLYVASLLAPVAATLLVALPALVYAWLSAPRAEMAPHT